MRQYHGLLAPIANVIARAVDCEISTNEELFPTDLQITDSRRCFFCPCRSDCHLQYSLPIVALRNHLIEEHHLIPSIVDGKLKKLKLLNRNKPLSSIRNKLIEIMNKIDLISTNAK